MASRTDLSGLWLIGFLIILVVFAPIAARVAGASLIGAGERLVEMNEGLGK